MEITPNDIRVLVISLVYALLGVIMLFVAYKAFDWLTPTDLNKAIFEEKNVAVGVAVSLFILGVATIIASAIR